MLPALTGIHPDICGKEGSWADGSGLRCGKAQSPRADKTLPGIGGQDERWGCRRQLLPGLEPGQAGWGGAQLGQTLAGQLPRGCGPGGFLEASEKV